MLREINKTFIENILNIYGDKGKKWLADLPRAVEKLAQKYHLERLTPVSNMSFNYVASGFQHAQPIILKLGLNEQDLTNEKNCLLAFTKHSAAKVIAYKKNVILMERAVPGTTLKSYFPNREIESTKIICQLIDKLRTISMPEQNTFHSVESLLDALNKQSAIPQNILIKSRKLRDELLATTEKRVLLHGDLHHENILRNGNDWLIIDPKGFIGDSTFELAAYMCNPIPDLLEDDSCKHIIETRIKQCSALLNIPEERIKNWSYVKATLCWSWALEDNLDPSYFKKFIHILELL